MAPVACAAAPRAPHGDRHHTAHMSINMLRLQIRRHLVLLHVSPHVLLPCVPTTPACVDRQLIRWLTPRSEPMQRATSSFSIHWSDFGPSVLWITSWLRNVVLLNLELLKRRASKNVMLPKHPSDQSKTLSNHGRAAYSTHGSLTMTSLTTSFFNISRSTLIGRDSTTKLMVGQSSLFFESCQVLGDQNSLFFQIRRSQKLGSGF
ncbi:hypothetical protein F2Q69_00006486 [Brassica cretica]|uniref:Uncharacterized protein n=1 Tax=Brassica cretica TaxID=69181 RepID=A0A8S9PH09_BRACR|nr:hypothetical protein F2Q69_00006486 [Brassica cretica]